MMGLMVISEGIFTLVFKNQTKILKRVSKKSAQKVLSFEAISYASAS